MTPLSSWNYTPPTRYSLCRKTRYHYDDGDVEVATAEELKSEWLSEAPASPQSVALLQTMETN